MKTLCAIVAFSLVLVCTSTAQNNYSTENELVLDGTSNDFNKQLNLVKKKQSITALELDKKQFNQLIQKFTKLKSVQKLELVNTNLSNFYFPRLQFLIDTLVLNTCEPNLTASFSLPVAQHLVFTNVNDRYILNTLALVSNIPSIEINQCELNNSKVVFKKLEELNLNALAITDCELERFPFNINKATNLKHLDLSNNQIWLMDTIGLYKLQSFMCEGNPLEGYITQKKKVVLMPNGLTKKTADNAAYFKSEHPFLKPASENINVVPQKFVVNTKEAITLNTLDKAQFSIPPNCFVDQNGNPVTGNVDVIVREYNDALAIMVAGIPMFTDTTKGNTNYLVSDGMFEVQAYTNGQPLEIAPGKSIGVDYPSANNSTKDNQLWDLNPNTGSWDNISAASNFDKPTKRKTKITPALVKYRDLKRPFITVNDTSGYEYRFNSKWYSGTTLVDTGRVTKKNTFEKVYDGWNYQRYSLQAFTYGKEEAQQFIVRLIPKTKETRKWANAYRLLNWQVTSEITDSEKEKLLKGSYYGDARFVKKGDHVQLQVKDAQGVHTYDVEPFGYYGLDEYTQKRALAIVDKVNRKIELDRKKKPLSSTFNVTNRYAYKRYRYLYRKIKPLRNAEEKRMSYVEFIQYASQNLNENGFNNAVAYQFNINKVGMKNIDCLHSIKNPKNFSVKTVDNDTLINSYIYQPAHNTVINFSSNTNQSTVFAEGGTDTYVVNMSNDDVSYTKITKKEMAQLPDGESICTHVKEKTEDFKLDKMDEKLNQNVLKVYPNPNNGLFSLNLNSANQYDVMIYASNGKLLLTFNQVANNSAIDASSLINGNYIIAVKNGGATITTGKLIISK